MRTRLEIEDAKARVRRQIREERRTIDDKRLTAFLTELESRIFDEDFKISTLKKEGGFKRVLTRSFKEHFGVTPKAYVNELKMIEADKLVRETKVRLAEVAHFVGMKHSPFTQKFKDRFGDLPSDLRNSLPATDLPDSYGNEKVAVRYCAGSLEMNCLNAEIEWLGLIQLTTPEERRQYIRGARFESRSFIDLLGEKYLEESRKCRGQGVEIAELALESLEVNAKEFGGLTYELRCLCLIFLSNAKRLAFDYAGANEAIQEAETVRALPAARVNRQVEAKLLLIKARLRFDQRRFAEAVDLINQAIHKGHLAKAQWDAHEGADSGLGEKIDLDLATALIHRAQIVSYFGSSASTIPDLEQARKILERFESQRRLRVSLYTSLAYTYSLNGKPHESLRIVKALEELKGVDELVPPILHWLRAISLVRLGDYDSSEGLLYESLKEFMALEANVYAGIVCLDLAHIHVVNGDRFAALRYASEALPTLESYGEYPEVLEILSIFREALNMENVTVGILKGTRTQLVRIGFSQSHEDDRAIAERKKEAGNRSGLEQAT